MARIEGMKFFPSDVASDLTENKYKFLLKSDAFDGGTEKAWAMTSSTYNDDENIQHPSR